MPSCVENRTASRAAPLVCSPVCEIRRGQPSLGWPETPAIHRREELDEVLEVDRQTLGHQTSRCRRLLRRDQVQRAPRIVCSPASPVRQFTLEAPDVLRRHLAGWILRQRVRSIGDRIRPRGIGVPGLAGARLRLRVLDLCSDRDDGDNGQESDDDKCAFHENACLVDSGEGQNVARAFHGLAVPPAEAQVCHVTMNSQRRRADASRATSSR